MKYFLEKGADVKATYNGSKTPLHWTAENGDLDVVKYLVEKGADVKVADNSNDMIQTGLFN
jgi:ankyrin repeat protein